ncbi:MAG: TIGR03905 family TSCPD domain-containing protein [Clostridia bacterium]|nr:TIGR03905 family TSCPD domain-containing protein [Clostridia bacterium]
MTYSYKTHGTCSRRIDIDVEDGIVRSVHFEDGCLGNTQGISRLCEGMKVEDVIARCRGIICRAGTSCPDQLAQALEKMQAMEGA